jgi:hypothetical protein
MENTNTAFQITTKDWESLISIMDNLNDKDFRKLKVNLYLEYKRRNPKPSGNDPIVMDVKERLILKFFDHLFGASANYTHNDTGGSVFERIIGKIRAVANERNTAGDNYLLTQLAAKDLSRKDGQTAMRKSGRDIILMDEGDSQ